MSGWNESASLALMMDAALKGTAILGVAWLTAFVMRGRSAATRHAVWTAAFAVLLALPLLSLLLPALPVSASGALAPAFLIQTSAASSGTASVPGASPAVTASGPVSRSWHPDGRQAILLFWILGTLAGMTQMLAGWAAMVRVRRSARPFAPTPGFPPDVEILESPKGSMPATFGVFRPAVLLPAEAVEWSDARKRVVLLHELAHVRRGDGATHLLARFALNLYWWNPLAWTAWRGFIKERERAADDLVLGAGECASEYAGHLLDIARALRTRPAVGWAAVAMARRSQLEGRLLAILDSNIRRGATGRFTLWAAAIASVVLVAPFAAIRAQEQPGKAPSDAVIASAIQQKNYQVLDRAAKAARAVRQYDVARKLLDSSLAIRGETSGTGSTTYGIGLLNLADFENSRNKVKDAQDLYARAAALLGSGPEAARANLHLGVLNMKHPDQAQAYFDRAQTAGPADPGLLKMWMAVVKQHQNNAQDADYLYQQALGMEDPNSESAATILEVYSQFLSRQDRSAEAAVNAGRAQAIRKAAGAPVPLKTTSGALRIGGGVSAPVLVSKIEPEYAQEARAAQLQGTVVLYVEIPPDGVPRNLLVTRGLGLGLDQKAVDAISQWKFKPGTKDGQPVTVAAQIEVNFRLL
jgi:TonB family protein